MINKKKFYHNKSHVSESSLKRPYREKFNTLFILFLLRVNESEKSKTTFKFLL